MPKFFRTLLLVLSCLMAMSVEMQALNASASGLPTHEAVVYAPFSDGQVLQMASVSAPSFHHVNSMLNRKVSTRGNYGRNARTTASSGSYGGTVISQRTYTVRSIGASTNSRGGSYGSSTSARRGATYSATGGAADRLGVANVIPTSTRGQSVSTTTTTTPSNGLGIDKENDRRPGELTPIGDAVLPMLLMLALYAAVRFIRRKANAGASSATAE